MPPFRAGLLKRKFTTQNSVPKNNEAPSDNETSDSGSDYALLAAELNINDEDDTESDNEEDNTADSEHEQDEVILGADDDSTLGEDEHLDHVSDKSSELTDSEGSEDSAEETESEDDDNDESKEDNNESGDDDNSEPESGIRQTHSSGSASDIPKQIQNKLNKSKEDVTKSIDRLSNSIKNTSVSTQPVGRQDEYESGDTSDEEDRRNTVGDIPMWWYNEYPHVGYDLDGRKIMKPPQRDQIDEFLKKCEDPEFWRTVRDPATGQDVVLSAADLALLRRLRLGRALDLYQPWTEWFSGEPLATPLRAFPDHKRSFLPSADERRRVARLVHALRMGWVKTRGRLARERRDRKEKRFYDLWGSAPAPAARPAARHVPAPRRPPPSHAESYNPPVEYLLDPEEMKEWESLSETPWKRKYAFLPRRHASLRAVPAYGRFLRERFLRCLDLYLAPRAVKMRLTISASDLVPKLPSPRELRPFPTTEALAFRGHVGLVRAAAFDPTGQYVVSGGDDRTLRVWETSTGRCLRTVPTAESVTSVAWVPAGGLSLVAAAVGRRLLLVNPGRHVGPPRAAAATDDLLRAPRPPAAAADDARTAAALVWEDVTHEQWERGVRVSILHFRAVAHVSWHARGDYLCVTLREGGARGVLVHQLSRRRSQLPFSRPPGGGLVQQALFHPSKPLLFVATQRTVRVYDLVKRERTRKLQPGVQWISCAALHPAGDNLLVGSYDRRLVWFDLELSARPYRSLRLHGSAVRSVAFHRRYPLFASAGDDRDIVVSHGMVYGDLLQNPLLVPLKRLPAPARRDGLCVLQLAFHPERPWLLAACADGTLRLYS